MCHLAKYIHSNGKIIECHFPYVLITKVMTFKILKPQTDLFFTSWDEFCVLFDWFGIISHRLIPIDMWIFVIIVLPWHIRQSGFAFFPWKFSEDSLLEQTRFCIFGFWGHRENSLTVQWGKWVMENFIWMIFNWLVNFADSSTITSCWVVWHKNHLYRISCELCTIMFLIEGPEVEGSNLVGFKCVVFWSHRNRYQMENIWWKKVQWITLMNSIHKLLILKFCFVQIC